MSPTGASLDGRAAYSGNPCIDPFSEVGSDHGTCGPESAPFRGGSFDVPSARPYGVFVKMSDIARLAGVSASTVSRALNDSPLVNEATKARIREIAARCDYQIDQRARNLRLRKTSAVAVIIPLKTEQPLSDPFFLELLGAIADALAVRQYQMLLARVPSVADAGVDSLLSTGRADGVLLVGQSTEHTAIDVLCQRVEPLVVWGQQIPGQRYPTVGSDNLAAGREVGAYLARCRYRRLAFLGDPARPEVAGRLEGFQRALEVAGYAPDRSVVRPCPFIGEAAYRTTLELLRADPTIEAIFASSDVLAMGAISAARAVGRSVPEELAVVGFDDIPIAAYYNPALSTVRQNIHAGGRALVEMLFARLEGKPVESRVLPTELILRQTTLPPSTVTRSPGRRGRKRARVSSPPAKPPGVE